MAWDIGSNLGSAVVTTGGTDAPASGTIETFVVSSAINIPAISASVTQFRIVDAAMVGTPSLAEVMIVQNVNGASWTVMRGAETIGNNAASPVAHSANWTAIVDATAGGVPAMAPRGVYQCGVVGSGTVNLPAGYQGYSASLTTSVSTPFVLPPVSPNGGESYALTLYNQSGVFSLATPTFTGYSGNQFAMLSENPNYITASGGMNVINFWSNAPSVLWGIAVTSANGPAAGVQLDVLTAQTFGSTYIVNDPVVTGVQSTYGTFSASTAFTLPPLTGVASAGKEIELIMAQPAGSVLYAPSVLSPVVYPNNTTPNFGVGGSLTFDRMKLTAYDGATWTAHDITLGHQANVSLINAVGSTSLTNGFSGASCMTVLNAANVGDIIVAYWGIYFGQNPASVTNIVVGGGATTGPWTVLAYYQPALGSFALTECMAFAQVTGTGTASCTAICGATVNSVSNWSQEFSKVAGTGPWTFDGTTQAGSFNVASNSSSGTQTWPSLSTTGSHELYVGGAYSSGTWTAGGTTGFVYVSGSDYCIYNTNVTGTIAPTASSTSTSRTLGALIKA